MQGLLVRGCTLEPPVEDDSTIRARRRCDLMPNYFDHLLRWPHLAVGVIHRCGVRPSVRPSRLFLTLMRAVEFDRASFQTASLGGGSGRRERACIPLPRNSEMRRQCIANVLWGMAHLYLFTYG